MVTSDGLGGGSGDEEVLGDCCDRCGVGGGSLGFGGGSAGVPLATIETVVVAVSVSAVAAMAPKVMLYALEPAVVSVVAAEGGATAS